MNKQLKVRWLTLFSLLFFSVSIYAQEKLVTIHLEKVSLKEVFSAIEKQTTYRFSYRDVVIDPTKNVTISQTQVPVSSVLDAVLEGKNLEYRIVSSKSIVITDKRKKSTSGKRNVSGVIRDGNGEPIVGANVVEKGTTNGTITDIDGNFVLGVSDNSMLQISYIGYVEQSVSTKKND